MGLLAAPVLATAVARGGDVGGPCMPRASPSYTAGVAQALRSGRDLWGEELLSTRSGPSSAGAAGRLAPLFYARTSRGRNLTRTGAYYLLCCAPAQGGAQR